MLENTMRRPVKNFFLKKSLQFKIIIKIILFVLMTSCITTLILGLVYNAKSQEGNFYYMSNDVMQDLELTSVLGIILPALIIAQVVSLFIAIGIGMFSSRKVAVPVYKLEKWAQQLKKGKLKTHLGFRETNEMKDLMIQCNALADTYRAIFKKIENSLTVISKDRVYKSQTVSQEIATIEVILGEIDFKE